MNYLYKANDGTIFEDEYKCILYEFNLKIKDANIIILDKNGNKLNNIETKDTYNKAYWVIINNEVALDVMYDIRNFTGFYIGINCVGTWKYDDVNNEWNQVSDNIININSITWHYNELPESNPYKRYLVLYAPWNYNLNKNESPRFDIADYYVGEPGASYDNSPWHLTCCHSVTTKEIIVWADIGEAVNLFNTFLHLVDKESEDN